MMMKATIENVERESVLFKNDISERIFTTLLAAFSHCLIIRTSAPASQQFQAQNLSKMINNRKN